MGHLIYDVVVAYLKLSGTKIDFVLVVIFELVDGIVGIQVFVVGHIRSRWGVREILVCGNRGISLISIDFFVALQNFGVGLIKFRIQVVLKSIGRNILRQCNFCSRRDAESIQKSSFEIAGFVFIFESIKAYILIDTSSG